MFNVNNKDTFLLQNIYFCHLSLLLPQLFFHFRNLFLNFQLFLLRQSFFFFSINFLLLPRTFFFYFRKLFFYFQLSFSFPTFFTYTNFFLLQLWDLSVPFLSQIYHTPTLFILLLLSEYGDSGGLKTLPIHYFQKSLFQQHNDQHQKKHVYSLAHIRLYAMEPDALLLRRANQLNISKQVVVPRCSVTKLFLEITQNS